MSATAPPGRAAGAALPLVDVVAASAAVAATRSRREKTAVLSALLSRTPDADLDVAIAYLAGAPLQDRHGIGWALLRDLDVPPAAAPSLTVADVHAALAAAEAATGPGSRTRRRTVVEQLFGAATAREQDFLRALLHRELRQGAQAAALQGAIAASTGVPLAAVRRAVMLSDDPGAVARAARVGGTDALAGFRLRVGHPVQPMLAQSADSAGAAVAALGRARVEHKLDGARVQAHRDGDEVRVFTRNRRDATARVPDLVAALRTLPAERFVLDGEAIAFDDAGRALPFQVTMGRFGTRRGAAVAADDLPLTGIWFDVLHVDGEDLLDEPLARRAAVLAELVPPPGIAAALVTDDPDEAEAFAAAALRDGQEGVVVKDLRAPYAAGRRGAAWRKVKPVRTLDLVVLAVERGSGRRSDWLSNLHLGARATDGGGHVMVGKTFKGLTDEMLQWQTRHLDAIATHRDGHVVHVRPELVVEIALDGVQASSRYPGGVALRFARVVAHRPDKDPSDADTIATVQALLPEALRA